METSALVPLVHAVTGNAINGFPVTLGALNNLTGSFGFHFALMTCNTYMMDFADVDIKAILDALEQPGAGSVAECRTRLLIAIGIVKQAL
jgi:hypothetical protein